MWIKYYLILVWLVFSGYFGLAQPDCSVERYIKLMEEADSLVSRNEYTTAIKKYTSAKTCQPDSTSVVDERITSVFEKVNRQREKSDSLSTSLERQQDETKKALNRANNFVDLFVFGEGRQEKAAWAFDDEIGNFCVIDTNGVRKSKTIYQSPEKFKNGIALARVNNQYVLVSDDGKEKSSRAELITESINNTYLLYKSENSLINRATGEILVDDLRYLTENLLRFFNKRDSVFGLVNWEGKIIQKAKFKVISYFSEGRARVRMDDKWGVIDMDGNIIVDPQYEKISYFSEGRACVRMGNKWGVIDMDGDIIVEPQYEEISDFSQGWSRVRLDEKWGVIDMDGDIVVEPQYEEISYFSEGRALVSLDERWGVIDMDGDIVVEPQYEDISNFSEGRARVMLGDSCWGLIDMDGNIIVEPKYEGISDFSQGRARVRLGDRWGVIDMDGNTIVGPKYEEISDFIEGRARVRRGNKWGVIDIDGDIVMEPKYDYLVNYENKFPLFIFKNKFSQIKISPDNADPIVYTLFTDVSELLSKIRSNKKLKRRNKHYKDKHPIQIDSLTQWGFLDKNGYFLEKGNFDSIAEFSNKFTQVLKGNKWGLVDSTGTLIIETDYDWIQSINNTQIRLKQDNKYGLGLVHSNGIQIIKPEYESIDIDGNFIYIQKDKELGILNLNTTIIKEPYYDLIEPFIDGFAIVMKNKKYGFIDTLGHEIVKPIYGEVSYWDTKHFMVRKDSDTKLFNLLGHEMLMSKYYPLSKFSEGYAIVSTEKDSLNKLNIIDINGHLLMPAYIEGGEPFSQGILIGDLDSQNSFIKAKVGKNYWLINSKGEKIIALNYQNIEYYSDEFIKVQFNKKWGIVNKKGEPIIDTIYDEIIPFSDSIAFVGIKSEDNSDYWIPSKWKWRLVNIFKNKPISTNEYELVKKLSTGIAKVYSKDSWRLIDSMGNEISNFNYQDIEYFSDQLFKVAKGDKWGIVGKKGELILDTIYDGIIPFSDSTAFLGIKSKDNSDYWTRIKWKVVNIFKNKHISINVYDRVEKLPTGIAVVLSKDSWRLIDSIGNEITDFNIKDISIFSDELFKVQTADSKWGIIDNNGKTIVQIIYDDIRHFSDGIAIIQINDSIGLLNLNGEMIIQPKDYSDIYYCGHKQYLLEQNGAYGLYSPEKGVDLPCKFEKIGYLDEENGWIRVKRNGKWGWVDQLGQVVIPCRYDIVAPFVNGKAKVIQSPYPKPFYINTKGEFLLESIIEENRFLFRE